DLVAAQGDPRDGRPFATYVRDQAPPPAVLARPVPPGGVRHRFEGDTLALTADVVSNGERVGSLRLIADLARMNRRVRAYAAIVALVFLVAAAAAVLLSARLPRTLSGPILALVDQARVGSAPKD